MKSNRDALEWHAFVQSHYNTDYIELLTLLFEAEKKIKELENK